MKKTFAFLFLIIFLSIFQAQSSWAIDYFSVRSFNLTPAQFISEDPAAQDFAQPKNMNPYQHCFNNPVNYTDPDGRDVVGVHGGFQGNWRSTEGMMDNYRQMLEKTMFKDVPVMSLNFRHSGFMQNNPDYAAKLINNYQHQNDNLKIIWGHSMGADALAKAYGKSGVTYVDEINLVMPRASYVARNLQIMAQNAGQVNVFMLSKDSRRWPGYGDRSFETMSKLLNSMRLPTNVNIMQIEGFSGYQSHEGVLEQNSPVLDSIWNQYQGAQ